MASSQLLTPRLPGPETPRQRLCHLPRQTTTTAAAMQSCCTILSGRHWSHSHSQRWLGSADSARPAAARIRLQSQRHPRLPRRRMRTSRHGTVAMRWSSCRSRWWRCVAASWPVVARAVRGEAVSAAVVAFVACMQRNRPSSPQPCPRRSPRAQQQPPSASRRRECRPAQVTAPSRASGAQDAPAGRPHSACTAADHRYGTATLPKSREPVCWG